MYMSLALADPKFPHTVCSIKMFSNFLQAARDVLPEFIANIKHSI